MAAGARGSAKGQDPAVRWGSAWLETARLRGEGLGSGARAAEAAGQRRTACPESEGDLVVRLEGHVSRALGL